MRLATAALMAMVLALWIALAVQAGPQADEPLSNRTWLPVALRWSSPYPEPATPALGPGPSPTASPSPSPAASSTPGPTPSSTPGLPSLYILPSYSHYVDANGFLRVVGEVYNNTANYVRYIRIGASFFDSNGSVVARATAYPYLVNLAAHSRTCFAMPLAQPAGWSYYRFTSLSYWTDGQQPPRTTIVDHSGKYVPDYGWLDITGRVRNDEEGPAEYVMVIGALYSGSGALAACNAAYVGGASLEAGQTGSFELILFAGPDGGSGSYALQAEGQWPAAVSQ